MSPFYLAAWLAQLGAEGHSIFLVSGTKMPESARPFNDSKFAEENFHELNELLDKAKDPNEKPLQGGESASEELPPEFRDSWSGFAPSFSSTSLPGQMQNGGNYGGDYGGGHSGSYGGGFAGGYAGGCDLGGTDSVLESQRRLLEQATRRPGGASSGGSSGGSAPHRPTSMQGANPGQSAVEIQRRLLEEAKRGSSAGTGPGVAAGAAPSRAPGPNRVLDEQRRLLEEANRHATGQQAAGSVAAARLQGSGNEPVDFPVDFRVLSEMGFKEPQIRAAEALTKGNVAMMSNLLLHVRGVPANVDRDGKKLAEAIQGAVLGLDRVTLSDEIILDLVTILCADEVCLQAAGSHFDVDVLTEFLRSLLSNRGQRWSPEHCVAVSVAIDMMSAAPRPGKPGPSASGRARPALSSMVRPRGDYAPDDYGICTL